MDGTIKINSNYVSDILDEIALEGLDGITLEALWKRLSVRQEFCFQIDDHSKRFLWNIITRMSDIKFYEMPNPRESLKYYDYTVTSDFENAVMELDELYPYSGVKVIPGIFGSCQHFFTRVDVTPEVVPMNISDVEMKWHNSLVLVASQQSRHNALCGNECSPNIDFSKSPIHYEILERIGRCRYLGLATYGKGSIQSVIEDSKSVFHYFKVLQQQKLIKKHCIMGNLRTNSSVSKVYLTRFYGEEASENFYILQTAIEALRARPPKYIMPCDEFYQLFDPKRKTRIKKFKKTNLFKKYIVLTNNLPYRSFFPEASKDEWEKKSKKGEKFVRCFQLVNPDVKIGEPAEKDCDVDDEETITGFLPRGIFFKNMPIVSQAYFHVKNSGTSGISQVDLTAKMGLNKRVIRSLIKRLLADKLCKFYIEADGRKRSKRYIVGEDMQTKAAASELAQILSETSNIPCPTSQVGSVKVKSEQEKSEAIVEKLNLPQLQDENISCRGLKRISMIIKLIRTHKFRLFHHITKHVYDEEMKEGLTSRVDRVTINRILTKLEKDGIIKIINLTKDEGGGPVVKLYADPSFEPDNKLAANLFYNHTCYYSADPFRPIEQSDTDLENEMTESLMENMVGVKKIFDGVVQNGEGSIRGASKESELAYSPKFLRLNILHDLMFHLVYDYTGVLCDSQDELIEELCKTTAVDEDLKKEMPKLYSTQCSPYMFVPPLRYSGRMPGWFLTSDLLVRMPMSVAVKVLRVTETSPEFWMYLNHPIRKHFLIKDLPLSIRQILFNRRHQLGTLYCDLRRLSFTGLLQFGLRFGREYYQTSLYLNRNATLLDTTISPPDYYQVPSDLQFDVKSFYFDTKNDVKKYWMEMFNICMATNLGVKSLSAGKEIVDRELSKKGLKEVADPKPVEQVYKDDDGRIPGDHRGAAGLDSIMFSFLRSNWTGPITKTKDLGKEKRAVIMPLQKLKRDRIKKRYLGKSRKKIPVKSEKAKVSENGENKEKVEKDKEKERKAKRQRRTAYDEIDLEALKLMDSLRVTWSTAEDNLLLLCRVASMFLCPNTRTFVRIPWIEIRKVLQDSLPESKNKTQKAIGRRTISMMKNPTTFRSVNLCLEEFKQMPEAAERFDCTDLLQAIKPSVSNVKELQEQLYAKFRELVSFLKDRLSLKKKDEDLIPDTLEEFSKKFYWEDFEIDPFNIKIIRENVIRAILLSSLCCRSDKTSSAVQLFDIYRQYDEDDLQNAIKKLHTDKVITVTKKAGNSLFKSGKILPLTFSPYKLSFAFQQMLTGKFMHSIYPESFCQLNNLLQLQSDEEFEINLNECNLALILIACKGWVSFRTVLPEQIIAIDSAEISDSTYSKMFQRYCDILQFKTNSKVLCSSGKIISKGEDGETLEVGPGTKRKLADPETVPAKKGKVDSDDSDSEDDYELSKLKNKKEAKEEDKEGRLSKDWAEKATRSSRVILFIMREAAKKESKTFPRKLCQDACVVNASNVYITINREELEQYVQDMGPKTANNVAKNIISRALVPINLVDEETALANFKDPEHVDAAKHILEYISSKKEMGASLKSLKANFGHHMLGEILHNLNKSKIIIKSGIRETRYFSQKHATPWVLSSFKMTRLEREKVEPTKVTAVAVTTPGENETSVKRLKNVITSDELRSDEYNPPSCSTDENNKIKILLRPWIRIDGTLNRKVLDRFLGVILAYIMSNPGSSIRKIMDKFSPTITPVWTKDLVEILMDIGCISVSTLIIKQKPSLFSKSVVEITDSYQELEGDGCVYVDAKLDAVTTFGLFIGKKTYSRDFLVD